MQSRKFQWWRAGDDTGLTLGAPGARNLVCTCLYSVKMNRDAFHRLQRSSSGVDTSAALGSTTAVPRWLLQVFIYATEYPINGMM